MDLSLPHLDLAAGNGGVEQQRLKQKIDDAFAQLIATWHQRMLHTALQLLRDEQHALEATEIAFTRAYQWLASTAATMPPQLWMYRTTVKACLERLQLAEKEQLGCAGLLNSRPAVTEVQTHTWAQAQPPSKADASSAGGMIDRAIGELHPRRRTIFVLKHYEELSFDMIGDILEITPACAKSLYHGALVELKVRLSQTMAARKLAETN